MAYGIGYLSSSASGKCVICGVKTGTYLTIRDYDKNETYTKGTVIEIPCCDGEHYNLVKIYEDSLVGHAKSINTLFKHIK